MTVYTCDFEYDGVALSDLGYIVCEFGEGGGAETVSTGSEISFETTPVHSGKRHAVTGSRYDKCLAATFQICKDPETHDEAEMEITDEEFRELSRWLNRRDYRWFHKSIINQWDTAQASGGIIHITDGADSVPVKNLSVSIDPVQDLHGYDSPWPGGAGKNIVDIDHPEGDGYYDVNGNYSSSNTYSCYKITCEASTDYTASGNFAGIKTYWKSDGTFISGLNQGSGATKTFTTPAECGFFRISINKTNIDGTQQIEKGSSASSYVPYANVCPITGWTGVKAARCGKNLAAFSTSAVYSYQRSTQEYKNGGVVVTSTGNYGRCGYSFSIKAGQTYVCSFKAKRTGTTESLYVSSAVRWTNYDIWATALTTTLTQYSFSFTAPSDMLFFSIYPNNNGSSVTLEDFQLELGSSRTEYEEYTDSDFVVDWQTEAGIVYGGTLDVTTGELTVTYAHVDLGTLDWEYQAGSTRFRTAGITSTIARPATNNVVVPCICSQYSATTYNGTSATSNNNKFGIANGGHLAIRDERFSDDAAAFKIAVDGVQFVYPLATPQTYQLTPTEITTLLGENNIWADSGDAEIEYRVMDENLVWHDLPWHHASFTLTRIDIGKTTYGIELSATTDSPFGYANEEAVELSFASGSLTKTFEDLNDEIGDTYPDMTITCGASGTLTLSDDVTGCSMEIKNCVSGEVISISGEAMIISTSSTTHAATLADDFNYDFFRFGNTFESRTNTVTASIPCTVVLKYRPIMKNTL